MDTEQDKKPRDYRERLRALREASRETQKNQHQNRSSNQRGILKQSSTSLDKNREFKKGAISSDGKRSSNPYIRKIVGFDKNQDESGNLNFDQNFHPNIKKPSEVDDD